MGETLEPPMEVGELRVIRDESGSVSVLLFPDDVGVVRVNLGGRKNATKLGELLLAAGLSDEPMVRRLTRVKK